MLAHDVASELPTWQAEAESLMTESCTIAYPTGTVPDPVTGEDVTTYGPPVYGPAIEPHRGKCKVQDAELQAGEEESASSTTDTTKKRIDIPVSAPTINHGAVVTVADGREFRVLAGHRKTWQTAQRLPVEVTFEAPAAVEEAQS